MWRLCYHTVSWNAHQGFFPFSTIKTSIYERSDSPNLDFVTQCHPQTFLFSFSTILLMPKVGMHLFGWVAQQLPSVQTQLRCLKPVFVTFQKHVLSMRIYASHAKKWREERNSDFYTLTEVMPAGGWQWGQESQGQSGRRKGFHTTWCSHLIWRQVLFRALPGWGGADLFSLFRKLRFHWSPGY